ncbi:hypothetical protein [Mameliella sediminis]|uniref:hypothetical protein n=1 Tax=Mameliella sediminis TaxID=2836866 RepID=UPI001C45773F|nr:hypothetical protein [Mameliella sediminis]MBV7397355.1 hypothetical protein [Mameliella sediminis]
MQKAVPTQMEHAPDLTEFAPGHLQYHLRAEQPFSWFDAKGACALPVSLTLDRGAPLTLAGAGPHPLNIGGRVFVNAGSPETPEPGQLISESRALRAPVTLHPGQPHRIMVPAHVPEDAPPDLLIEIDLVKEHHFWGSALGHEPLRMVLASRRIAIRPARPDPTDMTEALMQLHDARAREDRYEAVIFLLLNQLSARDR